MSFRRENSLLHNVQHNIMEFIKFEMIKCATETYYLHSPGAEAARTCRTAYLSIREERADQVWNLGLVTIRRV